MTAKEWLGVMQQAENYNPAMTKLIEKYGQMLLDEHRIELEKEVLGFDLWKNENYKPIEEGNYQGLFRHRTSSEIRGVYTSKELYDSYQTMKHLLPTKPNL